VTWNNYVQLAANSNSQFQDKPAITLSGGNVFESWTQFGSCSGSNVASPIRVDEIGPGATGTVTSLGTVPGSTNSQGSSIAPDGAGGIWVAWEEWPSPTATVGTIKLNHWTPGSGWGAATTISPSTFEDMPSPLPGFAFRDNSFPALAMSGTTLYATWCAFNSTLDPAHGAQTQKARCSLYVKPATGATSLTTLDPNGGHEFFPAVRGDGSGGAWISYSKENLNGDGSSAGTYDTYKWHSTNGTATKVSTASSDPSQDNFFSGQFIGDYNGLVVDANGGGHPIWTDIRGPDPNYATWEMDAVTAF
jgi:hypothetical protein